MREIVTRFLLAKLSGATGNFLFANFAGGDQRIEAAGRKLISRRAHALAHLGAVRRVLAAQGVIVARAGELDA